MWSACEVTVECLWSDHDCGVTLESLWSDSAVNACGVHVEWWWGVCGVTMQSLWSVDCMWTDCGVTVEECLWSGHGVCAVHRGLVSGCHHLHDCIASLARHATLPRCMYTSVSASSQLGTIHHSAELGHNATALHPKMNAAPHTSPKPRCRPPPRPRNNGLVDAWRGLAHAL